MQIVIDIPSPFIDHFHNDRFYDALMRLSSDAHLLAGQYEQETAAMLIKAFENAVEIPEHGRLVDADAFSDEMKERQDAAMEWKEEAKDSETAARADAVLSFLSEVKLTLDKLPTVIPEEEA